MYATKRQKDKVVDMISLRALNLNEEYEGKTILMMFLLENNVKSARKLVNRGADLNFQNSKGETALHVCIKQGNVQGIEWLLQQKKIDKSLKDYEGNDAYDLAR